MKSLKKNTLLEIFEFEPLCSLYTLCLWAIFSKLLHKIFRNCTPEFLVAVITVRASFSLLIRQALILLGGALVAAQDTNRQQQQQQQQGLEAHYGAPARPAEQADQAGQGREDDHAAQGSEHNAHLFEKQADLGAEQTAYRQAYDAHHPSRSYYRVSQTFDNGHYHHHDFNDRSQSEDHGHHDDHAHSYQETTMYHNAEPQQPVPIASHVHAYLQAHHGADHAHHHHHHYHHAPHHVLAKGQASLLGVTFHKSIKVAVAQPVAVPVERPVPVAVPVPHGVPVDRPYPVAVEHPVPVPVDRPVPYEVPREVRVPVEVVEKVPFEVPVPVPRYRPVPVPHYIPKPVPVPQPYPVTILVKEHIHENKAGLLGLLHKLSKFSLW